MSPVPGSQSNPLLPFLISAAMLLAALSCGDDVQVPVLDVAQKVGTGKPGWHWSNPQPQGNELLDVSFFDENVGFAVGRMGAIVRSTDGGQTWTLQASGVTDLLFGVATSGAMTATAVGLNGTILQTSNRGATWRRQESGVTAHLMDVDFADAHHGIVIGDHVILRTLDGGATWTSSASGLAIADVEMVDPLTAFAVAGAKIYGTADGGATWDSLAVAPGFRSLEGVSFSDANTGTVVGQLGTILRTTDAGLSWSVQESQTQADLSAVEFADASHGIAVASNASFREPSLLHTSDGGEHWLHDDNWIVVDRVSPVFYGVSLLNATTGVVVGSAGNILRTTDGGTNWVNTIRAAAWRLNGLSFATESDGIAVGLGEILRTADGGGAWERQFVGEKYLTGVSHCGEDNVVAVGQDREPGFGGGVILRSTDRGVTWATTHPETPMLLGVDFAGGCVGTIVGEAGTILVTANGGATWNPRTSQTVETLYDVSMLDANTGVAVGSEDTILRTIDGGATWSYQPHSLIHGDFVAVDFADAEGVGMAVGSSKILRTSDGGLSWAEVQTGMDAGPYEVVCRDRDTAVVLASVRSSQARVLVTTDGGVHWVAHEVIAAERLNAITISGKRTVTAAGWRGTIIQARDLFRPGV